ncbi:MAG: GcrA family cell cycle regulator [Alphaproteobacteria bacterium]
MAWTDERVEQLKQLWADGLSASQIARQLGGVTRNAVIGKVHRLGLSGRGAPARTSRPKRVTMPKPAVKPVIARPAPAAVEDPVTLADGNHANVLTIRDSMCKWPIGDPAQSGFHFCGRPTPHGSSYCKGHAQLAYQPPQSRRDKKRAIA